MGVLSIFLFVLSVSASESSEYGEYGVYASGGDADEVSTISMVGPAVYVTSNGEQVEGPVPDGESLSVGGSTDVQGCLVGAGFSWCEAKNKCLRVWEEDCPTPSVGTPVGTAPLPMVAPMATAPMVTAPLATPAPLAPTPTSAPNAPKSQKELCELAKSRNDPRFVNISCALLSTIAYPSTPSYPFGFPSAPKTPLFPGTPAFTSPSFPSAPISYVPGAPVQAFYPSNIGYFPRPATPLSYPINQFAPQVSAPVTLRPANQFFGNPVSTPSFGAPWFNTPLVASPVTTFSGGRFVGSPVYAAPVMQGIPLASSPRTVSFASSPRTVSFASSPRTVSFASSPFAASWPSSSVVAGPFVGFPRPTFP